MPNLNAVNGMGRNTSDKLCKLGIKTTSMLLRKGALPEKRIELAEKLGLNPSKILKWVIYCDFFRLKGMKPEYVDLLQAAGIATVQGIMGYDYEDLARKLSSVDAEKRLVSKLPSRKQVISWIAQAQELPGLIWFDGMYCLGLGRGV